MTVAIERLRDVPTEDLADLLAESEEGGLRFLRRLVEEWASGVNRFDGPGETLFGAWADGRCVGICGLNVDPYAGNDRVGRVRHLYVLSPYRRLGIGQSRVAEVIAAAHGRFERLHLRTQNPEAARLYERLGFSRCADVPDCTHIMELRRR